MFGNIEIIIAMLEKVGMAALLVMAYRGIRHARFSMLRSSFAIGILFSFGTLVTMLDPLVVSPGIVLDIRTVMVALAALFGGPLATVIVVATSLSMRIYIGGAGMLAGCVSILLAAVVGLVYARLSRQRTDLIGLTILGLALSISLFSVFLAPVPAFLMSTPALVVRNVFGTVILGYLLAMEDRREAEYFAYKREAERDPLTGLRNRRALEDFDGQVRKQNASSRFAVLMIDIDDFKSLNDIYGHSFGDIVLRRLADVVVGRLRGFDIVVRYGGEEFCVVLKEATLHNARRIGEDIRQQVRGERFDTEGDEVQVTVSIGVAQSGEKTPSLFHVIDHADEALYEAKNTGRNRICVYRPDAIAAKTQRAG